MSEAVIIKGADELRRLFRGGELARKCLPALDIPLRTHANDIIERAQAAVPEGETLELRNSAFVNGPRLDTRMHRLSATVTAGYDAPHAPYAHEGVHGGAHVAPPKWLERTAQQVDREQVARDVGTALMTEISRLAK